MNKIKSIFWDSYLDFPTPLGIVTALLMTFILCFSLAFFLSSKSCFGEYEAYKPQWGMFSGCRIEWKGTLTPVEIIRNINQ